MATATEPTAAASEKYVEFDEFIDYQLTKTRSGIKATDLLTAFIGGAAAVLAYVLIFALFDHWVVDGGFGHRTRMGLLSLLVAGLAGWCVWKLVLPYFRKVTTLFAAKQIEQTQPDLQNSLLTLVDLKSSGRTVDSSIESALEKRSAVNLSRMDIEQAVDRRVLMKLTYVLFSLVVLTCAYVLFSPKKLSNSLWRALLPTSNVAVATRTRIDDVRPGDIHVLARSQLEVTADLSGEAPGAVTLLYSTADRRFVDEPVAMRIAEEGLRRYSGIINGENGRGILQNLTYRVMAGDAESRPFTVTVKQAPSATVHEVHYEYPNYMGLAPRTQPGGAIDSWEGAWVTIRAMANMPITSAMVNFSDTEDTSQKAEEIPATIENETQITARWQLRIRSDGTYPGFYRLQCRNAAKETDPDPALHSVKIRPDQPPQIQLVQPTGDLERPANAIVPLLYAAEDPDFLLRAVLLHLEVNGEALPQQPRLYQAPPFRKSLHEVHNLELERIELKPGDRLTYWLEARDNMEPFADRSGNRANTPKLNIAITEPASPDQVQEQLEADQQQVAETLETAQKPPNAQPADPPPGEPSGEDTPPPPAGADEQQKQGDESPAQNQPRDPSQQQAGEGDQKPSPQNSGGRGEGGQQRQPGSDGGTGDDSSSAEQQQSDNESGSSQKPSQEESFDDLLKKLMKREQQKTPRQDRQQPSAGDQSPQQPNEQQSGEPPQNPAQQPGPQPDGPDSGNTAQSGQESASPGENSTAGSGAGQEGPEGASPPSTSGDPSTGSQSPMNDGQQPNAGNPSDATSPSSAENQSAQSTKEGPAQDGQKATDPASPPTNDGSTTEGPVEDGQKQAGTDTPGGKPGAESGTDPVSPKPTGPEGSKPPQDDQPRPQPGEPLPNPDAEERGQPAGPDEPLKGDGDPKGQQGERPQTGEGGNSQQATQGNRGSDQKGPGDPTGQSGDQQPSGEMQGQTSSNQPGQGSQQKPGGDQPGGDGSKAGGQGQASQGEQNSAQQPGDPAGGQPGGSGEQNSTDQPGQSPQDSAPQGPSDSSDQAPSPGGSEGNTEQQPSDSSQPIGPQQGSPPDGQNPSGESAQQGGAQGGPQGAGESPSQSGDGPASPNGKPGGGSPQGDPGANDSGPAGAAGGGEGASGDQSDGGGGEGSGSGIDAEDPDLAAKKKAANLVLQRLQDQLQRGEIDPELQQDLGLTPERLREFTKRLEERLAETAGEDVSAEAQARRAQFEETLRTIDFDSTGTTRQGGDGPREAASGFASPNRPAPPQHREAERLYRERLLKRRSSGR